MLYISFLSKKNLLNIKALFPKSYVPGRADNYKDKWARLKMYSSKYNAKTLIETGTYYGLTVSKLSKQFESIHSIEVENNFYKYNKYYFRNHDNIKIHFGDSSFILPQLLANLTSKEISSPIIFWLDGHCSENETGIGVEYSPLATEIRTIISYPYIKAIIIIDDLRLFDGLNYPTIEKIDKNIPFNRFNKLIDQDSVIYLRNII